MPPITSSTALQPASSEAIESAPPAAALADSPVAAMPPALASTITPSAGTVSCVPAAHVPVGHSAGMLVGRLTVREVAAALGSSNRKPATVSFSFAPLAYLKPPFAPRSIVHRSRVRYVLAIIFALLQIVGWGLGIYFLVHRSA